MLHFFKNCEVQHHAVNHYISLFLCDNFENVLVFTRATIALLSCSEHLNNCVVFGLTKLFEQGPIFDQIFMLLNFVILVLEADHVQ